MIVVEEIIENVVLTVEENNSNVVLTVEENNDNVSIEVVNELDSVTIDVQDNTETITIEVGDINQNVTSWSYLSDMGKTDGVFIPIIDGNVLVYVQNGNTIYRKITDAVDANGYPIEDSFYSGFDGTNLTGLISTRG